ncbi:Clp protease N-terminal domain-containing protein [Streptomyces sp. NPDC047725]|uniref:Clp protease N-terminal domain-containing protein n=1 Tax=Streptomyces sp. NPDC047725 TaxID=3365487 RepID=UPI003714434C
MQPRIPRQSAGEQGDRRPDAAGDAPRSGAELASVVSGARRRAVRDGDRQVDTAHLLHSLLELDPEARAVLGEGPQLARLFGYLVQRSIGYGLRWQSTVEDSGAVPVMSGVAGFSPLAAAAMADARARAARRGAAEAGGVDLLAALVADPQARAVEVLGRAAVDPRTVLARARNLSGPMP